MQQIEIYKSKLEKILNEKNSFTDVLKVAEEKTGVKRIYLALGLIAFVALYLMVGYGAQFLANFIGFLYPAYASVKAIESHGKDDDTKWLTYWVVYAGFSLVEFFADIFLFWIPLYAFLKCIFFLWCMAPIKMNGALFIYYKLIRPFVLKHQKRIDEALDQAADMAGDFIDEVRQLSHSSKLGDALDSSIARRAIQDCLDNDDDQANEEFDYDREDELASKQASESARQSAMDRMNDMKSD